jgi:hypothetical protein
MSSFSTAKTYTELQISIDKVIGKIGIERTIYLLDTFIQNTTVNQNEREKIKMISQYLITLAIRIFELEEPIFYTSSITEYRDARYCCFHLLRKYTKDSYPKIGLAFQSSSRIVMYGCTITDERLNFPKVHSKFTHHYALLESKLIEFIAKID